MPSATQRNWTWKVGIVLFLAGHLFSIAHASEHGPAPHEHDGVVCTAILNDGQEGLVPAGNAAACVVVLAVSPAPGAARVVPVERPRTIRPPPTGPPSIQGS